MKQPPASSRVERRELRAARVCAVLVSCSAVVLLASCVTVIEKPQQRGVALGKTGAEGAAVGGARSPQQASTAARGNRAMGAPTSPTPSSAGSAPAGAPGAATGVQHPDGPVATPAQGGTSAAHVRISVAPLGVVTYDAQTLPLISPDGKFLAVQQGQAPTWETLLALDGAAPALTSRIVILEVTDAGPRAVQLASPLPDGVILGRDASARAFLVESARPDGSRWIGEVAWATGTLTWLVQGSDVNAHAAYVPGEGASSRTPTAIVFSRRAVQGQSSALVLRDVGGCEVVQREQGAAMLYPTPSRDGSLIYSVVMRGTAASLVASRVSRDGPSAGTLRWGGTAGERSLGTPTDTGQVYQVFASVQPSAWAHPLMGKPGSILFANIVQGCMSVYDASDGTMQNLSPGSVAGATWSDDSGAQGCFSTTPAALVYQSWSRDSEHPSDAGQSASAARVLAGPLVPRVVVGEHGPCMLVIGPDKARADQLQITRVGVGGE